MFHGRFRLQTCKIIIVTSLVWFLLDIVLLMYFTDCPGGWACEKNKNQENFGQIENSFLISNKETAAPENEAKWKYDYPEHKLTFWSDPGKCFRLSLEWLFDLACFLSEYKSSKSRLLQSQVRLMVFKHVKVNLEIQTSTF